MVIVLGNVENDVFLSYVFHEEQIEKPVDNPFGFHGVDVCTKLLHYGDFPIYCNYQILGLTEESKDCRCIIDTKLHNKTLNPKPCFFICILVTSLHFLVFVL